MNNLMQWISDLSFREPMWLLLGLVPVFFLLFPEIGSRKLAAGYADKHLLPWVLYYRRLSGQGLVRWLKVRFSLNNALVISSWCLLVIALSGPRHVEQRFSSNPQAETDVIFILDVSHSMATRDVAPDRLSRAKMALSDLVKDSYKTRHGLAVFAAKPHLVIPPTSDKAVFNDALHAMSNFILPTKGSKVVDAIKTASSYFEANTRNKKILILVSDGDFEDDLTAKPTLVNELAQSQEISLHTLGVGSIDNSPVPGVKNAWLTHQGDPVSSRLNEVKLKQLAQQGRGTYSRIDETRLQWINRPMRQLSGLTLSDADDQALIQWRELHAWFLLPALILFMIVITRSTKRRDYSMSGFFVLAILVTMFVQAEKVYAADLESQAFSAYKEKSYEKAQALYGQLSGYTGSFGLGNSFYQQGNYELAMRHYTDAVISAVNSDKRANAIFNLANSYFKIGDYVRASDLYQDVISYRPGDLKATNNKQFAQALQREVEKELERQTKSLGGRGPRSADIADGSSPGGSLLLEETSNMETRSESSSEIKSRRELLIRQGIQYSRLASTRTQDSVDPQWKYRYSEAKQIAHLLEKESEKTYSQWKRLFELEEDYQVPLDQPQPLPGIRPW